MQVRSFGIDKLKIYTPDFQLCDALNWNHKPNNRLSGELEPNQTAIAVVNGSVITGDKLFYNGDNYSAEIKKGVFSITLNPSKVMQSLTSDPNFIDQVTGSIQKDIKENLSLDFDLSNSKLSRIDFAVDHKLKFGTTHYADIIGGSRKKYNGGNEYPNGFLFSNTMHQLMTYDRGKKNEVDQGLKHPKESNLMRFEARYTRSMGITSHCEFRTYSDLLESPTESMHKAYSKLVDLHWKPNQTEIEFNQLDSTALMDILALAIKHYPRNYIQTILLWTAQSQTGITAKQLETALMQLGRNKKTVQRQIKNYNQLINEISFINSSFHHQCIDLQIQKRNELIDHFILPYKIA
jgi:hypothetical protein